MRIVYQIEATYELEQAVSKLHAEALAEAMFHRDHQNTEGYYRLKEGILYEGVDR